jgi:hypothetical protein
MPLSTSLYDIVLAHTCPHCGNKNEVGLLSSFAGFSVLQPQARGLTTQERGGILRVDAARKSISCLSAVSVLLRLFRRSLRLNRSMRLPFGCELVPSVSAD